VERELRALVVAEREGEREALVQPLELRQALPVRVAEGQGVPLVVTE
jgi:hypothetical protein